MPMYSARWCVACETIHETQPTYEACPAELKKQRSRLPSPSVIMDTMNPVQSQVDGKMYDSKASIRASYKAHNVIEIGTEKQKPFKRPPPNTKANVEAIRKAHARFDRGERAKNRNWSTKGTH